MNKQISKTNPPTTVKPVEADRSSKGKLLLVTGVIAGCFDIAGTAV